ncbi:MAG TPA: hypothetical protein PLZ38_08895 [Spirochaetota bacterium]|nr:hypothetical protein [Spirochaetota bacterium]HRV32645.1 hypothetical protein [Candidatus Paceibacterota bacterium]HOR94075.1 hypothetical protein [Spirochaetota bacterium]HPK44513.1 hypothetical protein [Spirochaetota bacterium]HQG43324.1 hypothetical protein [Spirochaetota bacterium]
MAFYDLNGSYLNINQFIQYYEQYYFLGTPNVGRRITNRNKTNHFIEKKIQNILQRGIAINDIVFIIAWKIGAIDHGLSNNRVVYKYNFNNTLQFKTRFNVIDVKLIVNYIINNFVTLININNPHTLFQNLFNNRGLNSNFGLVYCISLIYFFTQGQYPIYDKYVHIAINAFLNNVPPNNQIGYQQINQWKDYINFINQLTRIFGNQNIGRKIDRALWVYGHCF